MGTDREHDERSPSDLGNGAHQFAQREGFIPSVSGVDIVLGSIEGDGVRLGICCSRFNLEITTRLLDGARAACERYGVADEHIRVVFVPGAFELPFAARALALSGDIDAVVCLGAVIRGETGHYDLVAGQAAAGCQQVQLTTGVPVAFGVLTTDDVGQALERSGGRHGNKGGEAVEVAIEMVRVAQAISGPGFTAAAIEDGAPVGDAASERAR